MKRKRKCWNCGELFPPDPRSYRPSKKGRAASVQHFCSIRECRKASHRQSNVGYWIRDVQLRERNKLASRSWRRKNKGYWRTRRQRDPAYTRRNRELQRRRDAKLRIDLANTDTIGTFRAEKLKRIGVLIRLANTDTRPVRWTLVSEEIRLFLAWRERLANTNSIDRRGRDESQSPT